MLERCRSGVAAPAIPAPESALRSHPCVAVIVAPKERCWEKGFPQSSRPRVVEIPLLSAAESYVSLDSGRHPAATNRVAW